MTEQVSITLHGHDGNKVRLVADRGPDPTGGENRHFVLELEDENGEGVPDMELPLSELRLLCAFAESCEDFFPTEEQ